MSRMTIVIPCYNEADRLDVEAFRNFTSIESYIRFLFVNDGSTDQTKQVLDDLQQSDPGRFSVHDLPYNMGKAQAVRQGILQALAEPCDFVGFWDADLATPLEAISDFYEVLSGNPRLLMVTGARVRLLGRKIERQRSRHYLGRLFATATSLILGLPLYDTQCGAKLFRAHPDVHTLFDEPFVTNWIFDVELFARLIQLCRSEALHSPQELVYELPLQTWCDVAGSKLKPRDYLKACFGLLAVYWTYLRPAAAKPVLLPTPAANNELPTHRRAA